MAEDCPQPVTDLDELPLLSCSSSVGSSLLSQFDLLLLAALSTIQEDVGDEHSVTSWSPSWVSDEDLLTVASLTKTLDAAEKAMDTSFESQSAYNQRMEGSTDAPDASRDDSFLPEDAEEGLREQPTFDSMWSEASDMDRLRMIKTIKISAEPFALVSKSQVLNNKGATSEELIQTCSSGRSEIVLRSLPRVRSWATAPPALRYSEHPSSAASQKHRRNSASLRARLAKLAIQENVSPPLTIPSITTNQLSTGIATTSDSTTLDPIAAQQWMDRIAEVKKKLRRRMLDRKARTEENIEERGTMPTISEDHEECHCSHSQKEKDLKIRSAESETTGTLASLSEWDEDDSDDDSSHHVDLEMISITSQAKTKVSSLCTTSTSSDYSDATTSDSRGSGCQALRSLSKRPKSTEGATTKNGHQKIPLPELKAPLIRSFSSSEEEAILTVVPSPGSGGIPSKLARIPQNAKPPLNEGANTTDTNIMMQIPANLAPILQNGAGPEFAGTATTNSMVDIPSNPALIPRNAKAPQKEFANTTATLSTMKESPSSLAPIRQNVKSTNSMKEILSNLALIPQNVKAPQNECVDTTVTNSLMEILSSLATIPQHANVGMNEIVDAAAANCSMEILSNLAPIPQNAKAPQNEFADTLATNIVQKVNATCPSLEPFIGCGGTGTTASPQTNMPVTPWQLTGKDQDHAHDSATKHMSPLGIMVLQSEDVDHNGRPRKLIDSILLADDQDIETALIDMATGVQRDAAFLDLVGLGPHKRSWRLPKLGKRLWRTKDRFSL